MRALASPLHPKKIERDCQGLPYDTYPSFVVTYIYTYYLDKSHLLSMFQDLFFAFEGKDSLNPWNPIHHSIENDALAQHTYYRLVGG